MAPPARSILLSGLVAAGVSAQSVQKVMVGQGGLKYVPNVLTANEGDQIEFYFVSGGHNVVQGDFSDPCQPMDGGFYSGFVSPMPTPFTITVNSSDPIWFYCSQVSHCQAGMVGVINPPSGMTIGQYASAAADTEDSGTPDAVTGGVLASASAGAASSTMASMSSASMSSASMSMSSSMMMSSSMATSLPVETPSMSMSSESMVSSMPTSAMSGMASESAMSSSNPYTGGVPAATMAPLAGMGAAAGLLAAVAGIAL